MILQAGPWLGEFGWELMKWVPYVRNRVWYGNYDKVVIVCRTGHEYLYKDFADEFLLLDTEGFISDIHINNVIPTIPDDMRIKGAEILEPSKKLYFTDELYYKPYGIEKPKLQYDLLIHARNTDNMNTSYRNWDKDNYNRLVRLFPEFNIGSIGTKKDSLHIDGTDDLRGTELEELCNILSHARLAIGPSSGPMHLASLCLCPHVSWSDKRFHNIIKGTNRQRYDKLWNPFNTKVQFVDNGGWDPKVQAVHGACHNVLNSRRNKIVLPDKIKFPAPAIAMVTHERPEYFESTINSLEMSNINLSNLIIFDDYSQDLEKQALLRFCKYKKFVRSQRYGVLTNSRFAIDAIWNLTNDPWFVYCQDDIIFSQNWYQETNKIVELLYKRGVDWGILALVYYNEPRAWSDKEYNIMPTGHPGGACWAINRNMWAQYRQDNNFFMCDRCEDRQKGNFNRREKLFDFKLSHWCHSNDKNKWAVVHVKKSLVKHIGADSTLSTKDMGKFQGLNYAG